MSDSLRHIEVDGHRIAIAGHNEDVPGRPLVVLHGVALSLNIWPHALHHTLRHRRWYAVGLPAHFPSEPPADFDHRPMPPELLGDGLLRAIRAVIGEQPFTLLGHSTGGYAALAIAAAAPAQVHGACAISGFAQGRWRGIIGLLQGIARLPVGADALFALNLWLLTRSPWVARALALFTTTRPRAYWQWPPLPATMAAAVADLRRGRSGALRHFFAQMHEHDIRDRLPAVQAPVLLLHGGADPIVPFAQAQLIAHHVPHAELARLNGVGHMPFAEQETQFAAILEEWFERVDG